MELCKSRLLELEKYFQKVKAEHVKGLGDLSRRHTADMFDQASVLQQEIVVLEEECLWEKD